ncbi:hypothetical protein PoB_007125200 [Plakobranchus ocellatus]|uniref:Uncharacterized protein n=1 Tax=Plakobranchus ocellatus TaxID=259542 RepID=A0AAV4DKD9_9GAST|nr:hypothetical protein PoB_007125200 [Plakobranchus ocellatus]
MVRQREQITSVDQILVWKAGNSSSAAYRCFGATSERTMDSVTCCQTGSIKTAWRIFSLSLKVKRKHRFNSSPQEFRAALRQTMVDAVLAQSKSQNCKEGIVLFSLDQVASLGANTAVHSRLRRDVPKFLLPLMSAPPKSIDMTLKEKNVMPYIVSYFPRKYFHLSSTNMVRCCRHQ